MHIDTNSLYLIMWARMGASKRIQRIRIKRIKSQRNRIQFRYEANHLLAIHFHCSAFERPVELVASAMTASQSTDVVVVVICWSVNYLVKMWFNAVNKTNSTTNIETNIQKILLLLNKRTYALRIVHCFARLQPQITFTFAWPMFIVHVSFEFTFSHFALFELQISSLVVFGRGVGRICALRMWSHEYFLLELDVEWWLTRKNTHNPQI